MQLTIDRAQLLTTLGHAQNVVERRTTIPILSNVRIDAAEGRLDVTATDLELMVHEACAAEVQREGSTTLPAHTFYDVVRKLPDGVKIQLEKEADASEISVRAGRTQFTLPTLPPADFPSMGTEALDHSFEMKSEELRRLIDKTRFAMSTEEARYYLNGVYLHVVTGGATSLLRAVATDGHRLARVEVGLPEGAAGMSGVIVPRKTVSEIRKLADGSDQTARISLSPTRLQVQIDDAVLISRLIDGTFPDYERVIPAANEKHLSVDTKAFAAAVDRVATIASEKSRAVKLALASGRLTVSAISSDTGRGVEELDASYADEALEIGFNARYVLDMLAQIEGDSVEIEIANPASPTLVRDPDDGSAIYVLMPMRV